MCNFYLFIFFYLAGADFQPVGLQFIVFSVGAPSIECVDFDITDDAVFEDDQDFTVELVGISSMAPHAMIGTPITTIVTIIDGK